MVYTSKSKSLFIFAPLTLYSFYLRPSVAPLHTLSKLYDVPVDFVPPFLSFETVYCFIWGRRRVAVAWYRMICIVLKTLRVCNFAKCEEKCMKQYRNHVWVCGNKYTNFWIHSAISLEFPKIHIFPKILQNARKFIMFIDKTLKWCLIIKIVIKHPSFYIAPCYNWGIK